MEWLTTDLLYTRLCATDLIETSFKPHLFARRELVKVRLL